MDILVRATTKNTPERKPFPYTPLSG
eukprot:COSAG04_NODE_25802_length_303_cov_0.759804_1_plen_25_part_01